MACKRSGVRSPSAPPIKSESSALSLPKNWGQPPFFGKPSPAQGRPQPVEADVSDLKMHRRFSLLLARCFLSPAGVQCSELEGKLPVGDQIVSSGRSRCFIERGAADRLPTMLTQSDRSQIIPRVSAARWMRTQ
jgi:hypothetical protein